MMKLQDDCITRDNILLTVFKLEFYQLTDTKGEIQDKYNQIILIIFCIISFIF